MLLMTLQVDTVRKCSVKKNKQYNSTDNRKLKNNTQLIIANQHTRVSIFSIIRKKRYVQFHNFTILKWL